MLRVTATDNSVKSLWEVSSGDRASASHVADLSRISNVPISELLQRNPRLLVFPESVGESYGSIGDEKILEMSGSLEDVPNLKIRTGNLMGFVGTGNVQLEVTSRFACGEKDFFLHYMLGKVFCPNLVDLKFDAFSKAESRFDYLCFLLPYCLAKAMSQGIFKTYRKFCRNDANVRGAVNISRHIAKNVPFAGRVAYTERARAYDNSLTELVRHAVEVVKTKPFGKAILSSGEVKSLVSQIVEVTPGYSSFERERILFKNAKPLSHPFFTEWEPLQKLCLAILQNERVHFHADSKSVYGLLFDGAWLFEEYLATVLRPIGFVHPQNKEHLGGLRFFDNDGWDFSKNYRKIYPDFYKSGKMILDAKYKHLDGGVCREDLYQVTSYMHTMSENASKVWEGGFVFPSKGDFESKKHQLAGLGGTLRVIGFEIPQRASDFSAFCGAMERAEESLRKGLLSEGL